MSEPYPDPNPERHWPAALALLTPLSSVFLPTLTARKLDHAPLWLGYLTHLAGGLMAVVLIMLLSAWGNAPEHTNPLEVLGQLWFDLRTLRDNITNEPEGLAIFAVAVVSTTCFIEAATLLVAWSMTAWAARPEPFVRSFRRSLSRTWLITSHACLYIGLQGVATIWINRLRWRWYGNAGWDWNNTPWWWDALGLIPVITFGLLTVVLIVVLFRAFSGRGWRACSRWPVLCEGCGYSLMGMSAEASCPECGLPVAESTTHSRRNRSLTSGGVAVPGDWIQHNVLALFRPAALGRRLHTLRPARHRAWMFVVTAAGLCFISTFGVGAIMLLAGISSGFEYIGVADFLMTVVISSSVTLLIGTMITFAAASVVGTSARLATRRNLMPLAMDASLALGGFLLIGTAIFWLTVVLFFFCIEVLDFDDWFRQSGFYLEWIAMLLFLGGPILTLVLYLILLGRITWGGRYANT